MSIALFVVPHVIHIQSQLEHLNSLDLFNCPVTKVDDYRSNVFDMLTSLNLLDGLNKDGEEVDEESDGEGESRREGGTAHTHAAEYKITAGH